MPKTFDVAILGATPGGLACAGALAKASVSVVVIDAPGHDASSPLGDWIGADTLALTGLPKTLAKSAGGEPFRRVWYYGVDPNSRAEYSSRTPAGYLLNTPNLIAAMSASAVKSRVVLQAVKSWPRIELAEDQVFLQTAHATASRPPLAARLLIVAQNSPPDVLSQLRMPPLTSSPGMAATALAIPLRAGEAATLAKSLHVMQLPDRACLGLFFVVGKMLHLRVVGPGGTAPRQMHMLSGAISVLQKASLLPGQLSLSTARGAAWSPPAGLAMEMETHVAKRCLLIGTAGGFADTITGQTLHADIVSGLLAADVTVKALQSPHVQESLLAFKKVWRKALVDYLRPPNTSLQMLLPLLFANTRIVGKFTRALLYGENI
ncbi:MAG: hypothetical protein ABFD92_03380 [Planctomycetaceae bacterium]|nr:hypothetical protein [Planctomycetaceae bacterium]